ncbi:MAG: class I SAM-dependent methyltransferase [Bacteroidota bacterium]|nr:rRNA methyltransferase [Candidatus Kapabacteria bacterium]MDW8220259.1 class I SAM-dependent methyltransferase [Bacteroidota bacterium]
MTKATHLAHTLITAHLASIRPLLPPDSKLIAIDATVGNGLDTVFLATCVGESGVVYGFDVQSLNHAQQRLAASGLAHRVHWIQCGHEMLLEHLPLSLHGNVHAIMFNLGYLPHSDKTCITHPATTIPALKQSCTVLAPHGILTVVCYTGHTGGKEETQAVQALFHSLPQTMYSILHCKFINQRGNPPELFVLYKVS